MLLGLKTIVCKQTIPLQNIVEICSSIVDFIK